MHVHILFCSQRAFEKVEHLSVQHRIIIKEVLFLEEDQIATRNIPMDDQGEGDELLGVTPVTAETAAHLQSNFLFILIFNYNTDTI